MNCLSDCPDKHTLERLLLGRVSDQEAEPLEEHLQRCGGCFEAVKTLQAADTLVEALGSRPGVVDLPPAEASAAADLIRHLKALRPTGGAAGDTTTSAGTPIPDLGLPDAGTDDYRFLAPPQRPDELGRLGTYRVLKVLGTGGMGVVFLAEDVYLERRVALKVLKPEAAAKPAARERFLREARAAAALEHENIVSIYQVGTESGVPFLAMQWLKGMSLEERLNRPGALSVAQVLRLGRQIACGLAAAHARGLIHRDIKPANLWLEPEHGGRVRILDFGLARAVADDVHLTQQGAIVGTPAYMAPEQARGDKVDHRADLFSLGCVLYPMLTGQLPFRGDSTMAVLNSLALDTPAPPHQVNPAVPVPLSELVAQLLAKDAPGRPQSAGEVADRLQALEKEPAAPSVPAPPPAPAQTEVLPPTALPATPRPRPAAARPESRRRLLIAAALVLVVLVPLASYFSGTIIRIATNKGELVIETNDPNLEVTVTGAGATIHDKVKDRRFVLTAGDYDVEVREEGEGGVNFATKHFAITRGGKETLNARLELAKASAPQGGPGPAVAKPAVPAHGIPAGDADRRAAEWVLSLGGKVMIRAADQQQYEFAAAQELPAGAFQLVGVNLGGKEVTDAGLEHLEGLTHVAVLNLGYTPVSDAGLEHLQGLTNLTCLGLDNTQVSDTGLEHLKALTNLTELQLGGTRVSDAELERLDALTQLTLLYLDGTQVSDAGLEHLKPLTNLAGLGLDNTQVSDAGLEHLKPLTHLTLLHLGMTRVSDAGLEYLKPLTHLTALDLDGTQVSDAGLAHLEPLTNLTQLGLQGTQVSDAGLEHLKSLTNLSSLNLIRTRVGDAGLRHLKPLTNLAVLDVAHTRVSDAGLEHLKGLTNLTQLGLVKTRVSDAGLKHLKGLTNLFRLGLTGTRVSDAGLKHLASLPKLNDLDLGGARVSAQGFASLKAALPGAGIRWSEPNRTAATAVLALGGTVHVRPDGAATDRPVKDAAELPAEYFRLTRVSLAGVRKPLADVLPVLAALTDPDFDRLQGLDLSGTPAAAADLDRLNPLTGLAELSLAQTPVGDADLERLKPLTGLATLSLAKTQVSDTGVERLTNLPALRRLVLDGLPIRAAGLVSLKNLPHLTELSLGCPSLTDLSVERVGELKRLERLSLAGSGITDAGLKDLHGLTNLRELDLTGTKVSAEGAAALQKALPKCKVLTGPAPR